MVNINFLSATIKKCLINFSRAVPFFVGNHSVGIIISLLVGMVIAAPPFIWRFSPDYQGVGMFKFNTELHYLSEVREVYDGYHFLGNPFFSDLKETPYLFPFLSPNIVWFLGKILFLSPVQAVMITRFIFTSLLSFVIYLLVFNVTKDKKIGWVAAPFVLLGYNLVDPKNIIGLLRGNLGSQEGTFIDYGRPINPQLSSLFFFSYLLCFWKLLHEKTRIWFYGIASSLILGLSFYVYLFTWTFLFSLNGFVCLIYLFKKDWGKIRKVIVVSFGAILLGLPYFFNYFAIRNHEWYADTAPRFGFINLRSLDISRLVVGGLLIFLLFFRRLESKTRLFFLAFFLTAFFTVNEHLITGLFIFNHHYHWYYNTPLVIIFLTIALFAVLNKYVKKSFFIIGVTGLIIISFFYNGIMTQVISYNKVLPNVIEEQRYNKLFNWLNIFTKKDETIFASISISDFIPALTHNNVYFSSTAIYTLAPNKRFSHAYLAYLYLKNIKKENIKKYLEENREEVGGFIFGFTYIFKKDSCLGCFSQTVIDSLAQEYLTISNVNFIAYLKKYPIDYIVWDKIKNPEWDIERFGLKMIKDLDDLTIYSVR